LQGSKRIGFWGSVSSMNIQGCVNIDDLRLAAKSYLPRFVFDYIDGGVEDEISLDVNRRAFDKHKLLPKYLQDVSRVDQSVELFGQKYSRGFGIGPTGLVGLARPGGDIMLAEAARDANIPFVLSGVGTASIESLMDMAPNHTWFQLYVSNDRAITEDLLNRASLAGIRNLMVTVDVPVHSKRERDIRNGLSGDVTLSPSIIGDMLIHPAWLFRAITGGGPVFENWRPYVAPHASLRDIARFVSAQIPFTQTWDTIGRLRDLWQGNFVVKGLQHPEDGLRASEVGVNGVLLSNHGGRALDSAPSPIETMASMRSAIGSETVLMVDSGVRRGADIVKCYAAGADFVFVGRSTLYGAAAFGRPGADHAISIISQEVELCLSQIGIPVLKDVDEHAFVPTPSARARTKKLEVPQCPCE
jgi:isopentenyl diphosphate isomerase/L-lactate dehydrogenase-like FMN-dependent dehydrogenase